MDLRKILISTLFFIILTINIAFSYDNLGTSAKAVGMGNAFVALADDPSGVFYNPAGLARLKGVQFSIMYDRASLYGYSLDEKPYVGFGSLVYPLSSNKGVLAFSGSRKASWNSQSQIVGHNILSVSYARSLGLMSSLGLNAKLLSNSNVDSKSGFEVDLGFLFPVSDRFSLGIVGENLLGTDMTPDSGTVYNPPQQPTLFNFARRQYKAGMALSLPTGSNSTRIAYDVILKDKKNFTTSTPYLNSLGVEQSISLIPGNTFFLRAGYTFGKDYNQDYKQWAWGLSYKFLASSNSIQIDYSYQSYPFQTPTSLVGDHRIGLTIGFGFAKSQDSFAQNKSSKKSSQTATTKPDKSTTVSPEVKPSTKVEQPDKKVTDQTMVKKEEAKVSQPTTTPTAPSTPMVTTPPASGTKVATTNKSTPTATPSTVKSPSTEKVATPTKTPVATTAKPKTTTTSPVPTPSTASKTTTTVKPATTAKPTATPTDKSKPTTVTQTPTTPTPTAPTDKSKQVATTKAPATTPTTKVVPKEKPSASASDKIKTPTVTQTPTTAPTTKPDAKVTPTAKPTTPVKTVTPEKPTTTDKSKEVTLAQVTPPATPATPTPAVPKSPEVFEPIKVSAKMDKIQTQSVRKKSNSYMFTFKVGLNDENEAIVDWKVYVCSSMPKGNSWEVISPVLIKTLEGRGNLPSGILWEVKPEHLSLATVHYAIQIKTSTGKKYFSTWQTGKMIK